MKKFRITFVDEIECDNEEQAYDILLDYLNHIVHQEDVTTFNFEELHDKKG